MRTLLLFLASFQLFFSSVEAVIQITSFGHPYGIVADNVEWTCSVQAPNTMTNIQKAVNIPYKHLGNYIKGESKSLPMKFEFTPLPKF